MVEIVELPDHGEAGRHHLGENRLCENAIAVGIEGSGNGIHRLAPRPEVSPPAMGSPAQGPVEGVAVGVGEAGQRDPVDADVAGLGVGAGGDVGDDAIRRRDPDAIGQAGRQDGA
jgi:hypothetical protein